MGDLPMNDLSVNDQSLGDLTLRISKLQLQPGDVLVLKSDERLTHETARRLDAMVRQVIGPDPAFKFMVLGPEFDLSITSKTYDRFDIPQRDFDAEPATADVWA